jgi:hypothetical protein
MRFKTALLMMSASMIALTAVGLATAVENRGAEQIALHGGSRGDIAFPHHRHQEALSDCMICHQTFPQQKGAIDAMKKSGELKPKQVMTKLCINCHRAKEKAGEKAGPTACNKCHQKG